MKRYIRYIFTIFLSVTFLSACQKEIFEDFMTSGFTASIEDFSDETKTSLTDRNYIAWSKGDRIAVFQGVASPDCYQVTSGSAGKTKASFEAVSLVESSDKEYDENIALYPYSEKVKCLTNLSENGVVYSYTIKNVKFPSQQTYRENSFPSDALVMAAITPTLSDRNLKFQAAGAVLRFKVKGNATLKTISVSGNSGEPLSGTCAVGVFTDGSAPSVSMSSTPASVTLDCGSGVALNESEAKVFMLCIPPTDFQKGFTVTFTDVNGVEEVRTVDRYLEVQRGHIFGMSEIVFGQTSEPDLNEPTDPDEFSLIDLGLSVKWANYNIGASSVADVGVSSDWGHEEGRDADCPTDMNISGSNYDLVKAELGGNWRLPTAFDFMELEQKCVWTPTTIDGVSGNIVTGPNGNSIFLPDVVYWTGTAREYSTDDYDYVYGIDKQPQSAAIASGKYNRPVQGPIRVFPDMTCTVKEVGKNSADIEVSVEDYSSYGIDLGLQLYVSLDGAFYTDEKTENEGVFSFEITELSSNTTYYVRASIDVLGYKMLQDLRDRVDFQTLTITDGDGCVAEPMDLGLSVKWASWNLGASCISDRGLKLDWGCISVNDNTPSDIYNMNISGTEYDPATVIWGPEWRLPTMEEWRELGSNYLDRSVNAMGGVLLKETLFLPGSEMGVTSYLSGEYRYGSYFLLYGYYYTGSISNNGYVRPVYDPMPQLGETIVLSVAPGSASLESSVIRIGGGDVTSKGFIYSTEESFDSNTSVTMTVNGDFEADIIGLSAETTYYVRAFATNSYGTSYGETITVTTTSEPQEGDYVDEYGINHGQGIKIGETVWAPVNCGYHETDYAYGKLYQWGRKYGQGYDGGLYDVNGSKIGTYSDATVPWVVSGPVSLSEGQSESNSNVFYTSVYDYNYDWLSPRDGNLWNSGTEEDPVKTEYDPCPEGWRVPTYTELNELRANRSSWTTDENGQVGYWFSGASAYTSEVPQVFFPAAGYRGSSDGGAYNRGYYGDYWSSRPGSNSAYSLYFNGGSSNMSSSYRAYGYSVRCVQK